VLLFCFPLPRRLYEFLFKRKHRKQDLIIVTSVSQNKELCKFPRTQQEPNSLLPDRCCYLGGQCRNRGMLGEGRVRPHVHTTRDNTEASREIRNMVLCCNLTLKSSVVIISTSRSHIQTFCILPTQCIYVFRMVLTINTDYFLQSVKWLVSYGDALLSVKYVMNGCVLFRRTSFSVHITNKATANTRKSAEFFCYLDCSPDIFAYLGGPANRPSRHGFLGIFCV
jgi:hypothetical protein